MAYFALAAGHGASDPGAVNGTRKEKDDNLKISLAVGQELVKRGHTVEQYREDDAKNCSWQSCREWLGKKSADLSIVFHRNAFNGKAKGVEVWSFDADETSCKIADEVSSAISLASGLLNRGRKGNGAAWINSKVVSIEPEIGFIDNEEDNARFDNYFNSIVKAICDTAEKFVGKAILKEYIATGTATNYLNIRKSPVDGEIITSMPTGSKFNIYSIDDGWAKLNYNQIVGYSSTDYMVIEEVKKTEECKTDKPYVADNDFNAPVSVPKETNEIISKTEEKGNLPPYNASECEKKGKNIFFIIKSIIELILKFFGGNK